MFRFGGGDKKKSENANADERDTNAAAGAASAAVGDAAALPPSSSPPPSPSRRGRFLGIGGGGGSPRRSPRSSPRSSPKAKLKFLKSTDSSPRPSPSASAAAARAAEITASAGADRPPIPPLLPLDTTGDFAGAAAAGEDAVGSPSSMSLSPTRSPLAMKRSRSGSASAGTSGGGDGGDGGGGSKRGLGGRSKSKKSKQRERQVELERAEAAAAMARMLMGDDEGGEQEQEVQPSNAAAGGINPAIQKLYDDGVISQSEYDHMVESDRRAAREHLLDDEDMMGDGTSEVVGDEGDASDAQQKQTRIGDDGTGATTAGDDNDAVGIRDEQSEPGADLDDTHSDGDLPGDAKDVSYYTAVDDTALEEGGEAVEGANNPPSARAETTGDFYLDLSEITATSEVSAKQEEQQKLNVSDLLHSIDENDGYKKESEDATMTKPEIALPPISTEGDLNASNDGEGHHHPITPAATVSMAPPATLSKAPHGSLTKDSRRNSVGDELLIGFGGVGGDTSSDNESDQITHDDVQPNREAGNDAEDDENGDGELLVGFGLRKFASERTVDGSDRDEVIDDEDGKPVEVEELTTQKESANSASAAVQSEEKSRDNEGGADKDDSLLEMLESAVRDGIRPSGIAPTLPADINSSKGAESCDGEEREEIEPAPQPEIEFVEQMESVWNQTGLMPAGGVAAPETIEDGSPNTEDVGEELTTPLGSPADGYSSNPDFAVGSNEVAPSTEGGEENSVECPLPASRLELSSGINNMPSPEGSPIVPAPISPASLPVGSGASHGPVPDRMSFPMFDGKSEVDERKPSVMSAVEDTDGGLLPSSEEPEGRRPPPQSTPSDDYINEDLGNLSFEKASTKTAKEQESTGVDREDSSQENEVGDEEIDQQDAESSSSIHLDHVEAEEELLNRSKLQTESSSSVDVPSENSVPCERREIQQPLQSDEFETETSAAFADRVVSTPLPPVETSLLSLTPTALALDPRSAMLAAISARRQPEDGEGNESELPVSSSDANEDAATKVLLEPAPYAGRQPDRNGTDEGENETMGQPFAVPVSAPNSGMDGSETPSPPEQPENDELEPPPGADDATNTENSFAPESSSLSSPVLATRGVILAAITARRQIEDDSADREYEAGQTLDREEKTEHIESESSLDPPMLAAMTARREPNGKESKIDATSSIAPVEALEETGEAETELPSAGDPEVHEEESKTEESSTKTDDILRPESASALVSQVDDADEDYNTAEVSALVGDSAPATADPRAAILSAIAARKQPDEDEDKEDSGATTAPAAPTQAIALDPRVALLSAIAARKVEPTPEPEPAPALDPRAAMLSAIAARKKPDDDDDGGEIDTPETEPAPEPAPALDPRAAMLSAIAARKVEPTPEPEPEPALDPRAAMLSAIAARKKPDDDDYDGGEIDTPDSEPSPEPAPALDPRAAMLSAIAARKVEPTPEPEPAPALDPRAAMLSAIAARKVEPTPEPEPALDPRAAMLSAIAARKKPDDDDDGGEIDTPETEPSPEPASAAALDPRAAMLSAIAARKVEPTPEPEPALDPRAAMLSAIAARKKPDDDDDGGEIDTPETEPSPEPASAAALDPRAAMLSAIAARKVEPTPEPEPEPALDPRAAMLSAIAARKKPDDDNSDGNVVLAEVSSTVKGESSSTVVSALDSRAAMLSAIEARNVLDDVTDDNACEITADNTSSVATESCLKESPALHESTKIGSTCHDETFSSSMRDYLHDFGIAMHSLKTGGEDTIRKYKDASFCKIPFSIRFAASVLFHQMVCRCKHASVSRLFAAENVGNFLTLLGSEPYCSRPNNNSTPKHLWDHGSCIRSEIQGKARVDAKQILVAARANFKGFEKVVDRIVSFARRSERLASKASSTLAAQAPSSKIRYSIGIKAEASIVDKSARKYGGDVARVKDVLRSQIVLPDEASIISTLLSLQYICSPQCKENNMKIIRIKNLFRLSPLGTIVPTDLPSGYRHVLINVRLEDGLVAEIQLNLERMYNILGADGYQLHRHIIEIEKAQRENVSSASEPAMQKDESNSNPLLFCRCAETVGVSDENASIDAILRKFHWHKSNPQDEGTHRGGACTVRPFPDPFFRGSDLESPKNCSFLRSHLALPDDRFGFLEKLESDLNSSQPQDLINAAMSSGLSFLEAFPRDSSAFMCLHKLFMTRAASTGSDSDTMHAQQALNEGILALDGAAIDHGAVIDPSVALEMHSAIVMFHCQVQRDWERASSVLQSFILRIKDHVPAHHPILLACNIDLAACYLHCGYEDLSSKCYKRAKQSLDAYLRQLEEVYFTSAQNRAEAISAMKALIATLSSLKRRRMTKFLGQAHPMSLFFQCCLGDAFSVLANCVGSSPTFASNSNFCGCCGESSVGSAVVLSNSAKSLWEIGAHTYRTALQGWVKISGTDHPNVASTASALSRCLRELDRRDEAIRVLSLVTDAAPEKEVSSQVHPKASPQGIHWMKFEETVQKRKEEQLAISMWLVAVYETERIDAANERREKAIHILRDIMNSYPLQSDHLERKAIISSEIERLLTAVPVPTDKMPSKLRSAMLSALESGDGGDAVKSSLVQTSMGLKKDTKSVDTRALKVGPSKPNDVNEDAGDEQLAKHAQELSVTPPGTRKAIVSAPSAQKNIKENIVSNSNSASVSRAKTSESALSSSGVSATALDPRAAMLSAIAARKKLDNDDDGEVNTAKAEPTPDPKPASAAALDPRAAMLSAIAARKKSDGDDDDGGEVDTPETEPLPKPASVAALDPRAAMLSAIAARKKPDDDDDDGKVDTAKAEPTPEPKPAPVAALDPRAAMLSAIAARKKPDDDDVEVDTPETEPLPKPAPVAALDPRAAMLSAIAARKKPDDDDDDGKVDTAKAEPTPEPKPAPVAALDPRAAMLSAIAARKKPDDDDDDGKVDTAKAEPTPEPKPAPVAALDPRAAMLSAVAARKKPDDDDDDGKVDTAKAEPTPEPKPAPVAALDPRAAMLSAIAARKKPDDDDVEVDTPETEPLPKPAPVAALDPRAAMLSAIAARKKPDDDDDDGKVDTAKAEPTPEPKPAPVAALDPRAAMLSAIAARKKPDDDDDDGKVDTAKAEPTPEPKPAPVAALDPRAAMLSAIAARKKPDDDDVEVDTPETEPLPKPAPVAALDPRAAMLSAIAARKKPDEDEENEESAEKITSEEQPAAPLDSRAALLASIKARKRG